MGRYAVFSTEVQDRYPRVTTDSRAVSTIESAYLLPAEAEVDARLGVRFALPFSSNNLTVKDLVIDMTMIRMGTYKDRVEDLQKSVDSRITALIAGTMVMVTASGTIAASALASAYSTTGSYHPVFGMGDVVDMKPDDDRVDDEEGER